MAIVLNLLRSTIAKPYSDSYLKYKERVAQREKSELEYKQRKELDEEYYLNTARENFRKCVQNEIKSTSDKGVCSLADIHFYTARNIIKEELNKEGFSTKGCIYIKWIKWYDPHAVFELLPPDN